MELGFGDVLKRFEQAFGKGLTDILLACVFLIIVFSLFNLGMAAFGSIVASLGKDPENAWIVRSVVVHAFYIIVLILVTKWGIRRINRTHEKNIAEAKNLIDEDKRLLKKAEETVEEAKKLRAKLQQQMAALPNPSPTLDHGEKGANNA